MTINVTFGSMDEMKDFARALLSSGAALAAQQAAPAFVAAPVRQTPQDAAQIPARQSAPEAAPVQEPVQQPVPQTVPTTQPSYTMEDLSRAGMTLMDSGRQGDLRDLLAQFGVQSLPELPKEQYGAFATALRGLGAQI